MRLVLEYVTKFRWRFYIFIPFITESIHQYNYNIHLQVDSSIISFCCGQINTIFGSSWASNASFAMPSWLAAMIGTGHGSLVSIDCSRLTVNIISMAVLANYLLSSYLMDQNFERMYSR